MPGGRGFSLLISAFPAVRYLQLFNRSIEAYKSQDISAGADYDDRVPMMTELARSNLLWVQTLQALNINMSIEETKIAFTVVQRLKTSRPGHNSLRVMIPKVLRNKSICPYSHLLHYIDRSTSLRKLSDSTQLFFR